MSVWKSVFCGLGLSSPHSDDCSAASKSRRQSPKLQQGSVLCSSTTRYLVQDLTGEGTFGLVCKGVNLATSKQVALKILKSEATAKREIIMLKLLSTLDPVKTSVVQFFEAFTHMDKTCLVFEQLDKDLFKLFRERNFEPLSLCEIRPITQQLLTALDALQRIGVVHSDIKPSNIMLTNHPTEPFRVKLIDFGVSFITSEKRHKAEMQPLGYRAPEVILGLPVSQAIDMWGLGCVLLFLYIGNHPFSVNCLYKSMRDIVDVLGQPDDHVLSAGQFTHKYFKLNQHWDNPQWSMKTPGEYYRTTGDVPPKQYGTLNRLDNAIIHPGIQQPTELEDHRAFASLLKGLLHTDAGRRATPDKALTHAFVSMVHLEDGKDTSQYFTESLKKMLVCQKNGTDETLPPGDETEEEPEGEEPASAITQSDDTCSVLSIVTVHDGARDGAGSAETTRSASGSHGEAPPPRVKSRMRRLRKYLGRAVMTLFGLKKT